MNLTKTSKYKKHYETLYFDPMWMLSSDQPTFRQSKHIYLGETRIATRMKIEGDETHGYETVNTYYYHSDHLGSANIITDYEGGIYEHIEYTPYGELWEEQTSDVFDRIPFRFTGKEFDSETALYYYGARYLDPRTSRWISSDPALESYVPVAPLSDEAKRHNQNLPGMGGVFNPVNLNLYGHAGNNPLKYVDPTGAFILSTKIMANFEFQQTAENGSLGKGPDTIAESGCLLVSITRVVNAINNYTNKIYGDNIGKFSPDKLNDAKYFSGSSLNEKTVDAMLDDFTAAGLTTTPVKGDIKGTIENAQDSKNPVAIIGRTGSGDNVHYFNIEGIDGNTVEIYDSSSKNRQTVDVRDLTQLYVVD